MVVRSLILQKEMFQPKELGEKILGPEILYLNVIGALMYLAPCIRPDIAFVVNLFAHFRFEPTRRHLNEINHIF